MPIKKFKNGKCYFIMFHFSFSFYEDAPGIPQIEGYIEGDLVTSGDTLTLACITRGGNPPPNLIWRRGNVQVDATYTVSGHVTTNVHTFRVDASDNNGVYRCEAASIMTKEPISASVKLSVHCKF